MKSKVIFPYLAILLVGIVLIVAFSIIGLNDSKETSGEKQEKPVAFNAEKFYEQTCSSCHGEKLEGKVGPTLVEVSKKYPSEEIKSILTKGKGIMPSGLVPSENLDAMVEWLEKQ